ncbi:hypothetical protein C0991_003798, partial [Blastosporella zonata]
ILSARERNLPVAGHVNSVCRIRATPFVAGSNGWKETPAHFDMVLVKTEGEQNNAVTKGTVLE